MALSYNMITLVKGVEGDYEHFEVAINGHLLGDVLTEGGLACCRSPCNPDQNSSHFGFLAEFSHLQQYFK